MTAPVPVLRLHGSAADLHGRVPSPERREAWWLAVDRPALVLGSAQRDDTVDPAACAAAGIDIARRRSGGGAVLLVPGEHLWLDVLVPRGDPWWDDDIGRSMWWLGDLWQRALARIGVAAEVHHGGLVRTAWSAVVCFDGLGAGEVTVEGAKAVGISQRRTRDVARLQSSVHLRWRAGLVAGLLAEPRPDPLALSAVWSAGDRGEALRAAVEAELVDVFDVGDVGDGPPASDQL